jgi:hypothetical protein
LLRRAIIAAAGIAAAAAGQFSSGSLDFATGHRRVVGALPTGHWRCPPAALALALALTLRQCGASAAETAAPQLA